MVVPFGGKMKMVINVPPNGVLLKMIQPILSQVRKNL